MSEATTDLHAQLAQRLFGFHDTAGVHGFTRWKDAAGTVHHAIPAYTTNPAATALVWQWVEAHEGRSIAFHYASMFASPVLCQISTTAHGTLTGQATTWPEALCRAALALAEALEREEGER